MTSVVNQSDLLEEKPKSLYVFCVAFTAAIGGFLFGYDLVIISGAQLFLRDQFALSDAQYGFATGSAILGCIAGPFLGMGLCDWFGRKKVLFLAGFLFVLGAIGTSLPKDIITFNVFRIIGGIGVGISSIASPIYIAEISPARSRGRLGFMYQLAIVFGAAFSTVVAYLLARYLPETVCWRWMFASVLLPVAGFVVLLAFVPESPRWLANKSRCEEAFEVLKRIDGEKYALKEIDEIKGSLSEEEGTFSELFQPGIRTALFIGILLAVFSNWTGWSGIAYFLPTIFQKAGYSDPSSAILRTLVLHTANIFLTLLAVWLVDKVGRRPLWNATTAMMTISMFLTGLVFHFNITGWVLLLVIFLCAVPHCIGIGPLSWLMMSEIYPTKIRAKAVAISTTLLWVAGFTGPQFFPILTGISERAIGSIAGIFWLYGFICILALIFGLKWLPETKGRTLENIAKSWLHQDGS
jgi:SP family arabinose:H+ symporter-like MFS transporter